MDKARIRRSHALETLKKKSTDSKYFMAEYDLELSKAAEEIKKQKAKTVVIQLPDGLKPKAKEIQKELEKKTGATILIWGGSCYGACDPAPVEKIADLLIQFGHSEWR